MIGAAVELVDVFCVHRTDQGDAAALQGATLTVAAGELLAVVGPSGAGKSTLLALLAGLQTPSAGIVRVLGEDIGRLPTRARAALRHDSIGFLGQRAAESLAPELPIGDAVAMPLALRGTPAAARRQRASELLGAAGLRARAAAYPHELSGGERQRAALCMALAHRPALLLADEPTGELDAEAAATVRTLIAELSHAEGATAIVVSHDHATAEIADRVVRLRDGRVVEEHSNLTGEGGLVVGRGGWLGLPANLVRDARLGGRVAVTRSQDSLIITSSGPRDEPAGGQAGTPAKAPPDWDPVTIAARGISRGHGRGGARREVLAGFHEELGPGGMIAVAGPSGSGKTTLLRVLAGLDPPDSGELEFDGLPTAGWDAERRAALRRARIGYLPQEPEPVGFLSADENVRLALALHGWDPTEARARAALALGRVGLAAYARQRVARLSAGERQRVALARALAAARGLLIVDEPTSRLDEANAVAVAELLADAAARDRQTVICATHDPLVLARADRVFALGPQPSAADYAPSAGSAPSSPSSTSTC